MIARFRILLPFEFSIPQGTELTPYAFTHGEYSVTITLLPHRVINAVEDAAVSGDYLANIAQANVEQVNNAIRVDDAPTIQTNLLQIDFRKPDFDRRNSFLTAAASPDELENLGDPPIQLAFT